jgi:predicted GH43/DUF377 family glycosyl hydrolase
VVHECRLGHGQVTACECLQCTDYVPRGTGPRLVARFDENNLGVGNPGKRFNASIAEDPASGGYVLAYRDGWAGSQIWCLELDRQFRPASEPVRLELRHRDAAAGREDPRLFWVGGHLCVAFVGVMAHPTVYTNLLFARIGRTLDGRKRSFQVEDTFHPRVAGRNEWEKNHSMFDHDGHLYSVYSTSPHQVMQVWGDKVEFIDRWSWTTRWDTELRGGASPIRVGDEYWSFFHSRHDRAGIRVYVTGLYTFAAQKPFRPRRIIPEPIDTADLATKPADQYCPVVFAGGAVRAGPDWVLACGIHDRWTELRAFSHAELERRLVPVESGEWPQLQYGEGI